MGVSDHRDLHVWRLADEMRRRAWTLARSLGSVAEVIEHLSAPVAMSGASQAEAGAIIALARRAPRRPAGG